MSVNIVIRKIVAIMHKQRRALNVALSLELELAKVAESIKSGAIIAIKGVGGYVLLADATNSAAVKRLRERKGGRKTFCSDGA